MTAHWGIPDPAAVKGTPEEIERAFARAYASLDRRISLFLSLPLATLDAFALQRRSTRSESNRCSVRLLIIGGSDAGISAALRARELDRRVEVTVLLADDFPNYSICGLPSF